MSSSGKNSERIRWIKTVAGLVSGGGFAPYLSAVGAILCWASLASAVGESLHTVPPEQVLFYGLLTAGLVLAGWELLRGGWRAMAWPGWSAAGYGVYGIWGYHTLLVMAFSYAPDVEANILNYTWSLWIVVLGAALPGHRFSWAVLGGGLIGFGGVVLVIGYPAWSEGGMPDWSGARMTGLGLALAAGICWGSFTAFMRLFVPPQRGTMAWFSLLAALAALGFLLARGVPLALPWEHLGLVVFIGLVPLGLSFFLWEQAAQGCQVQVLGFLSFLTPVLSTALLTWVSGESLGLPLLAGLGLILGGSLVGGRVVGQRNRGA